MRLWSFVSSHDVSAVAVVQVIQGVPYDRLEFLSRPLGVSAVRPAAGAAACRSSDFDVGDQLQQLLFGHQPLERRHDRLEAGHDLRLRVQDRLAEVGLVGHHRAAALRARPRGRTGSSSTGPRPWLVGAVAGVARQVA